MMIPFHKAEAISASAMSTRHRKDLNTSAGPLIEPVGIASSGDHEWKCRPSETSCRVPLLPAFLGTVTGRKEHDLRENVLVVEWRLVSNHSGPFAGRADWRSREVPGCGVYEFDPVNRKITAARIYFDVTTLLKQVSSHNRVLQKTFCYLVRSTGPFKPRECLRYISPIQSENRSNRDAYSRPVRKDLDS